MRAALRSVMGRMRRAPCGIRLFPLSGVHARTSLPRKNQAAFSLVELVATMVVIGILAAFAVPRMVGPVGFEARGVYDQAQGIIRYAQKIAIAQRQSPPKNPLFVVIGASSISICYDAGCASRVLDPSTGADLTLPVPNGITVGPAITFSFSGSGAPSLGAPLGITVSAAGEAIRTFYVEAQTGYVHD